MYQPSYNAIDQLPCNSPEVTGWIQNNASLSNVQLIAVGAVLEDDSGDIGRRLGGVLQEDLGGVERRLGVVLEDDSGGVGRRLGLVLEEDSVALED